MQEETTTTIATEGAADTTTATTDKSTTATDKGTTDASKATDKTTETSAGDDKGGTKGKSIATGGDTEEEDASKETKEAAEKGPSKAETWQKMREEIAKHHAAGDDKAYKKELKRLERISGPEGLYGMYRELESKFTSGGLVKVPGKNAKPEEIAEFHKALGVPEKAEDYLKDLKLENGAVIGDADKPVIGAFAAEMHKAGAPPTVMKAALDWYYKNQEDAAAQLDEQDDTFRRESEKALKDELGSAFKRQTNAIATLFATAPGGTDISKDGALYARLMGGRMADGRIIGNDPDMVRFLVSLVSEINPAATVTEDASGSGQSVETEINEIEKIMRTDRRLYNQKYANRYAELLGAREKMKKRA